MTGAQIKSCTKTVEISARSIHFKHLIHFQKSFMKTISFIKTVKVSLLTVGTTFPPPMYRSD